MWFLTTSVCLYISSDWFFKSNPTQTRSAILISITEFLKIDDFNYTRLITKANTKDMVLIKMVKIKLFICAHLETRICSRLNIRKSEITPKNQFMCIFTLGSFCLLKHKRKSFVIQIQCLMVLRSIVVLEFRHVKTNMFICKH